MKQEDRNLLLKDLSARLPYDVVISTPNGNGHLCSINQTIFGNEYGINISATRRDYFNDDILNFKPYLRPLSSITEKEETIFEQLIKDVHYKTRPSTALRLVDWLEKNMFDHRGLIPLGLAIEVTKENNPYKL